MNEEARTKVGRVAGAALGSPDLENQASFDRGRLIGLWEYDPGRESIVWVTFEPASKALKGTIKETEPYIRDQLGDARSLSLDSIASRAPRIKAIEELAASVV